MPVNSVLDPLPRAARIAFLLGKPVRKNTIFPEVFDLLRQAGASVEVHLPHDSAVPVPLRVYDSDLVVHRGLKPAVLSALASLEEDGARCCNPVAETVALESRARVCRSLADAGLPVPETSEATTWAEVLTMADGRPTTVKSVNARMGRGSGVLLAPTGILPAREPLPGSYVVQEYIPGDGRDRKVYVCGTHAQGLLKHTPPRGGAERLGEPFILDKEMLRLSLSVGEALGLEIYGVDFIEGPGGPVVVDVNSFPGFKGVPGGARSVARHLADVVSEAVWGCTPESRKGTE